MALEPTMQARLAALRDGAADRPAHLAYIDALAEAYDGVTNSDEMALIADDVPVPRGVSARYAEAIVEDVDWIFDPTPLPSGCHRSAFPHAYGQRRVTDGRASQQRQRTRDSFDTMLPGNPR